MIRIALFSGGKDSSVLTHMLVKKYKDVRVVFCDTGWELPETKKFIEYYNERILDGKLIVLKSDKYKGFEDMIRKRKFFPSVFARYCTQVLKIDPIKEYIKEQNDEVILYNGIRAEESYRRSKMNKVFYDRVLGCYVVRPLLHWSGKDIFNYKKRNNLPINDLYLLGQKRVGCGPCIMISMQELIILSKLHPERIKKIKELEKEVQQSFFITKFIPERYRDMELENGIRTASIDAIINYMQSKEKYVHLEEQAGESCMSFYNLCE